MIRSREIPTEVLNELIIQYTPLVMSTARKYHDRGAEFEDLVQEGFLALATLIPKCGEIEWLAAFLKSRLPGCVRAVAARLRCEAAHCNTADFENTLSDACSARERSAVELRDILEKILLPCELDLTQALMEGFTQKEIGEILGISQQAVSLRLRVIRDKLRPVMSVF